MRQVVFAMALLGLAASIALAQDPVKLSPKEYKVEIDNDHVRVLRVKRMPHGKIGMHDHANPFVLVVLTDAHLKVTRADGKVQELTLKSGDSLYTEPVRHEEENLSDQTLEALLVELKPNATSTLAAAAPAALDPVKIDTKHHKLIFENSRVRIVTSIREPGSTVVMHGHPNFVTIYLTDVHSRSTQANGASADSEHKFGDVVWREPAKHASMNPSVETTKELWVELKSMPGPAQ